MQILYQHDLVSGCIDESVEAWQREHGVEIGDYARELVTSVESQCDAIDSTLDAHLSEWTVDRLGAVERAIARIAMVEMLTGSAPAEVAIDEAVELSKRYASPEAARLINGALGAWLRANRASVSEQGGGPTPVANPVPTEEDES